MQLALMARLSKYHSMKHLQFNENQLDEYTLKWLMNNEKQDNSESKDSPGAIERRKKANLDRIRR